MATAGLVDQIYLVGMWSDGLPEHERLDEKRQIWRVRPRIGSQEAGLILKTLRYIEWQLRIFLRFRASAIRYVNCHSLPVLPLGALLKLFKRTLLIYDTHELETEGAGSTGLKRVLYKLTEGVFIRFTDAVITVNESITRWYQHEYRLKNVVTVRNVPEKRAETVIDPTSLLKRNLGLTQDDLLYIFQGSFGPGRGIETMLEVFSRLDRDRHVVFMGFGGLEERIREYERSFPNIHFHPGVKPHEVGRYTRGADVGLCLQENIGLNYYLSLPNKLFEYIINGVPVIVSDFPEMARVVDEGRCGWKIPVDGQALFELVTELSSSEIEQKRYNAREYARTIGWEYEEKALLSLYREL